MSSYEELLKEKSLDKLLIMANEEKNGLSDKGTALVSAGKGENVKVDFLSETERLLDYFNLCMPFKTVYSLLRELQDVDICHDIFLPNSCLVSGESLRSAACQYTYKTMQGRFNRRFVIGDKVLIVYSNDTKWKDDYPSDRWGEEYLYDRSRAFPLGSIGEILDRSPNDRLFVRFSFSLLSDWPIRTKPTKDNKRWETYGGANDNAGYKENELKFVPLNFIEEKKIGYEVDILAKKIDHFRRKK